MSSSSGEQPVSANLWSKRRDKKEMNCDTLDLQACRFTQGWCPHAAHQLTPLSCPTLYKTSFDTLAFQEHQSFLLQWAKSQWNASSALQPFSSVRVLVWLPQACYAPSPSLLPHQDHAKPPPEPNREVLKRNLTITFAARMISSQLLVLVMQNKSYRRRFKSWPRKKHNHQHEDTAPGNHFRFYMLGSAFESEEVPRSALRGQTDIKAQLYIWIYVFTLWFRAAQGTRTYRNSSFKKKKEDLEKSVHVMPRSRAKNANSDLLLPPRWRGSCYCCSASMRDEQEPCQNCCSDASSRRRLRRAKLLAKPGNRPSTWAPRSQPPGPAVDEVRADRGHWRSWIHFLCLYPTLLLVPSLALLQGWGRAVSSR